MRDHGGASRRGEDPADAFVLDSAEKSCLKIRVGIEQIPGMFCMIMACSGALPAGTWLAGEVLPRMLLLWNNRLEVSREIDY